VTGERRPIWPRIGIAALNLLVPGLGLLRVGSPRLALIFLLSTPIALFLLELLFRFDPGAGFETYVEGLLLYLLVVLGAMLVTIVLSWRRSRIYGQVQWWSRWFTIIGALIVTNAAINFLFEFDIRPYRSFYIPSVAMAPTLEKNDRLFAAMNPHAGLRRGDLVLVEAPNRAIYIKRVAGLPGDRIELLAGLVFLNGRPVPQIFRHNDVVHPIFPDDPTQARRSSEQFPGEARSHDIYDLGYRSDVDDFPLTTVAPGHIFLLGDNRDQSADSRVSIDGQGLEQVPLSKVKGVPLFTYWGESSERRWIKLRR
jgi:signal peptidase I